MDDVLPPSSRQLSDSFVAVFGQNKEDLSKCQLLTVSRSAYRTLVEERMRVNNAFVRTTLHQQAGDSLPENGVPQQFIECGVQMAEVDKYAATRCGPGTVRDPLDATGEDDDASDEISDASGSEDNQENANGEPRSSVGQPTAKKTDPIVNQFETPLGLDPTSTPDFVQHVASYKTQLDIVHDTVKQMRSGAPSTDANVTAQAAADEECYRAVVDLREAAQKLNKLC